MLILSGTAENRWRRWSGWGNASEQQRMRGRQKCSYTNYESDSADGNAQAQWLEAEDAKHPRREGLKFDWIEIEK